MIVKHTLSADAGELSPWLDARTDMAKYAAGFRTLENFVVTPQGGVTKRPGMDYLGELVGSATSGRLIEFQISSSEAAILALGGGEMRFWLQDGSMVTAASVPYTVAIPWADGELAKLRWKQINDVMYFVHGSHSMRRLLRYSNTNWVLEEVPHGLNHPLLKENLVDEWTITTVFPVSGSATTWTSGTTYAAGARVTDAGATWAAQAPHVASTPNRPGTGTATFIYYDPTTGALIRKPYWVRSFIDRASVIGQVIDLTSNVDTWDPLHVGSVWQIATRREANSYEVTLQATLANDGLTSSVLVVQGGWTFQTFGTWRGTFVIERSADNGATWQELRSYTSALNEERNASTEGTEESRVLMRLKWDYVSAGSSSPYAILSASDVFVRGLVKITEVTNAKTVKAECLSPVELDTTSHWSEGAWSDFQGYPSVIETHQARLVVAATARRPHSVWGSAVDDFPNFKIGTDDSMAYWHTIPVGERDPILWLTSERLLLIGTGAGEFVMSGETEEKAIVPEFGVCRRQTSLGSSDGGVSAIFSDTVALFVQRGGVRVREFSFKFEADRYEASNLNILADHLFGDAAISDATVQRMPFQVVWFVAGGQLYGLTYERTQNVVAWHRHLTDGSVVSVASIRTTSIEDQVWFLVARGDGLLVERFHPGGFINPLHEGGWLDSAVNLVDPYDITDVSHLDGHAIAGVCDGAIYSEDLYDGFSTFFITALNIVDLPEVDVDGDMVAMEGRWNPVGERNGKVWWTLEGQAGDAFRIEWTLEGCWVIYGNGEALFTNDADDAFPSATLWTRLADAETVGLTITQIRETPLDHDPFMVVANPSETGIPVGTYKPDGTHGGKTKWTLPGTTWFLRWNSGLSEWEHGDASGIKFRETTGGSPSALPSDAAGWYRAGIGGIGTFTTVTEFYPPVRIGLPYTSTYFPMRPEIPTGNGSSRSREVRIHAIVPSLYKSMRGKFGTVPGGSFYPLDESLTALFTGEMEKAFPGNFTTDGDFCLISNEPSPFAIRSVAIKFNVYGDAS